MPEQPILIELPVHNLGTRHSLPAYRYGRPGARPKVYIQAGIHADELAAPLAAHHLVLLLEDAQTEGAVTGDITVVPVANPLGLSQQVLADHLGRYDLATGRNYNRAYPDVSDKVVADVEGRLTGERQADREIVAGAIASALAAIVPKSQVEALQVALTRQASDCDYVIDLHTDSEAEMHLYLDPGTWPEAADLAGELDASVVMLSRGSGGNPFEETLAAPWHAVRARFGPASVPAPLTTVIELRGYTDAFDDLAARDAAALYRFLQRRGAIAGDPGPAPEFNGIAAPFEATELLTSPAAGIVAFKAELGAMVKAGDVVAEIVDVMSNDRQGCRTPVRAEASGRLFTRTLTKLARPGSQLGKIQGTEPLPSRTGFLLTD